jgi:hypothetical protein
MAISRHVCIEVPYSLSSFGGLSFKMQLSSNEEMGCLLFTALNRSFTAYLKFLRDLHFLAAVRPSER